jgi:hypothetical protein
MREIPFGRHFRDQLALEHRPGKRRAPVSALHGDAVGDQRPVQPRGELGGKVAGLIGMGQKDLLRIQGCHRLCQCGDVAVRRVRLERWIINQMHGADRGLTELRGRRRAGPDD